MPRLLPILIAVVSTLAPCTLEARAQATFQPLGLPTGTTGSGIIALNRDGSVAVGSLVDNLTYSTFRWTRNGGYIDLLLPPQSWPTAVSDDGAVVAGGSQSPYASQLVPPFRWTGASGAALLPVPPNSNAYVRAINGDGSVIVGYVTYNTAVFPKHAVRWIIGAAGDVTMEDLGLPPNGHDAEASGVSSDGTVVVGTATFIDGVTHAFRWTHESGMMSLGHASAVLAISSDGAAVMGLDGQAFRWTSAGGRQQTSFDTDMGRYQIIAMAADVPTIVGRRRVGARAYLWNERLGTVDLNEYLPAHGADIGQWSLTWAEVISADGRTVAGNDEFFGVYQAWIATLPQCGSADFDHDGTPDTDADIAAFFACIAGNCCPVCGSADFDADGDTATDFDIQAFFRVLGGGSC